MSRWLVAVLWLAGCGGAVGGDDGGTAGFAMPTLEVTVNGVHAGPATPDAASVINFAAVSDAATGSLQQSTFHLAATAAAVAAGCQLDVSRYGDGIAPIDVGSWQISGGGGADTPDGVVAPLGAPTVSTGAGAWQCTGSGCDGALLQLTRVDSTHAEGYFGGTFVDGVGNPADVVCAFYLPVR